MDEFLDEKSLLNEIKQGNNRALEFLFKNYYPRLYGYAIRFVCDPDAVNDIIQECYIKLWEKHQELRIISVSSLLFAMVRNGCLNYLKHHHIVEQYKIEYLAKGEERLYHSDFSFDSDYKLLYDELEEQINLIIDKLPKRCRKVFLMSRFEGMKNKEIALELGISLTAVEKHIARALESFTNYFRYKYPTDIYIIILAWLIFDNM